MQDSPANPVHHCTKQNDGTDTTDWSYVYFGSYPQTEVTGDSLTSVIREASYDGNGDAEVNGTKYRRISKSDANNTNNFGNSDYRYFKWERIKWRVLQNDGSTLFVVADKGLDCKDYNETYTSITWENCTLRNWLNSSFYNSAFSNKEQEAIVKQTIVNEGHPDFSIESENDTIDKVYLLSIEEATNLLYGFCEVYSTYTVSRYQKASDYAYVKGAEISTNSAYAGNCWWWLRSAGYNVHDAAVVNDGGYVYKNGHTIDNDHATVVPALHIDLSSDLWFMEDEKEHTHSFSTAWQSNSEVHWKECECGEKSEYASHSFIWVIDEPATEASTGLKHEECEVCSCKRNEGTVIDKLTGEHTHSYREWGRNVEAHWKECECGDTIEMEPHFFYWVIDEPATKTSTGLKHEECKVCSYKRSKGTVIDKLTGEHTHSFSASWKSDAKSHWIECECGEKFAAASHAFTWVIDKPATEASTGLKHEECSVCGYKRNKNTVIGKLGNTPVKGQKLTDRKSGAAYKVVIAKTKGGAVEYTKPLNNKTANISIPSTVKINGISYKVTSIAANAFKNNKKVTKVKIGSNVISIGKEAFRGCSKLKTLTIGNNVVSIEDHAFCNCTSLKTVTIPTKVKEIRKAAFYGCKKLKTIKISAKKLTSKNVGGKAFAKIDPKATVKVPASCLKSYKKLLQKKGLNGKKQKIKK